MKFINKQSDGIFYATLLIISIGNIVTNGINVMLFVFILFPLVYKSIYTITHKPKKNFSLSVYFATFCVVIIYYIVYAFVEDFRFFVHDLDSILVNVKLQDSALFLSNNTIYALCSFSFLILSGLVVRFLNNKDLKYITIILLSLFYSVFLFIVNRN